MQSKNINKIYTRCVFGRQRFTQNIFFSHSHHHPHSVSRRGKKQPRFYPVTKEPGHYSQDEPRKRKTRHSSNPPVEMHVGWIMDSRDHKDKDESVDGGAVGGARRDSISESVGSLGSR
jgi:hypothetical protein